MFHEGKRAPCSTSKSHFFFPLVSDRSLCSAVESIHFHFFCADFPGRYFRPGTLESADGLNKVEVWTKRKEEREREKMEQWLAAPSSWRVFKETLSIDESSEFSFSCSEESGRRSISSFFVDSVWGEKLENDAAFFLFPPDRIFPTIDCRGTSLE